MVLDVTRESRDASPRGAKRTRVLMLMEDYRGSYTEAVEAIQARGRLRYEDIAREAFSRSIYYGDAYLSAFGDAGVTARQVVPACWPLQRRWAIENGMVVPPDIAMRKPFRWFWTRRGLGSPQDHALERIVEEQVRRARPDILWVFSGVPMTASSVERWRASAGSTVLWWSCALVESTPYDRFDLILSCIQPLVEEFRRRGLRAEYMPHAFDARVLDRVSPGAERIPRVAFVGNLSPDHRERVEFLDALAREIELDFYGLGVEYLPLDSPLRARSRGPVWGDDLYRVYANYAVVVHKNIDVAGNSPSAKRLFEATGMGACVLTEDSDDIAALFTPGTEVVTYQTIHDCVVKARDLLASPRETAAIGRSAQRRTLEEHTYSARVQHLLSLTRRA